MLNQENVLFIHSDEEVESDDEYDLIYVEEEEEEEEKVDVDHEDIGFRVKKSDQFHNLEKKSNSRLSARVCQVDDTSYSSITTTLLWTSPGNSMSMDQDIRMVGTLKTSRMMDFIVLSSLATQRRWGRR